MKIEHVCLNVKDIEKEKDFYVQAFGFKANKNTITTRRDGRITSSPRRGGPAWSSFLMRTCPFIRRIATRLASFISPSLGGKERVDQTTEKLRAMGLI
jgi:catechol 2,3-dioxygenase-like lactoylglutathione lyase family enzyme